jgi:hypothetical protein
MVLILQPAAAWVGVDGLFASLMEAFLSSFGESVETAEMGVASFAAMQICL